MNKRYFKYGNYNLKPYLKVNGYVQQAFKGYDDIIIELKRRIEEGSRVIVCDFYPGVDKEEVRKHLMALNPVLIIDAEECVLDEESLNQLFAEYLTDDRVFGFMCHKNLEDCFLPEKLAETAERINRTLEGVVLVLGVGASLVTRGDILLYFDMARWEIQLRYRRGMPNWKCTNEEAPVLEKYKRGFFVEWRLADKYKRLRFDDFDYVVDTNRAEDPKMITGGAFRQALVQASGQPFRVQPYFDPGVWGGHWMQENFRLGEEAPNYAWSFDGVPEENSLNLKFGDIIVELPAIDLVFYRPCQLLGEKVYGRFGAEFPIRFDLLDTMGGENLSLQVHPLTEYIQDAFGMNYTQDESYYVLDCEESAGIYLGLKDGIDPEEMEQELRKAEQGDYEFPVEKYVNKLSAKKHDHVLIPAGTVHCSGADTMILEISATPYIFTFKMWDWGRTGLDGRPRPIHLNHGIKNIQWDRNRSWVEKNLIHQEMTLQEEEGILVERTGLHRREFIETHRYTLTKPVVCRMDDSVHVLNLIEGEKAVIESITGSFEPFEVHYAETFIIPADVSEYRINPTGASEGCPVGVIVAFVR
ncbi:MAG: class I mannose-6-phosphate isomerase [Clostridiales bacterium]|nr:class I mannose-6-phosphate isomerase [Clostridiales bacterium]